MNHVNVAAVAIVASLLVGCGSSPRGGTAASTAAETVAGDAGSAEIGTPAWATCKIGSTISCTMGAPAGYPAELRPSVMGITVESALHETRHLNVPGSDLDTLQVRPEGFPYSVRFNVTIAGVGDFLLTRTFQGPNDPPIEAPMPLPFWHIRVLNPEGLDGAEFTPDAQTFTRSVAPYTEAAGGAEVGASIPDVLPNATDVFFPAPPMNHIEGALTIPAEAFTDPPTVVRTALEGPGLYEARRDGLHLVSQKL
jgi:hypothetical protein